ncbi:hypothetical protein H4W30_000121 [Amycolatopsis roodepoortensis]|uniref:Uncharacterized protein n=1 Tax=Amycolatopsis roodepoortensis TaxID=700274 RepID=A0ABR9KXK2_9PSEU|nr:hypothetical protein [Amycolatopsis roodepoortensis]
MNRIAGGAKSQAIGPRGTSEVMNGAVSTAHVVPPSWKSITWS